MSRAIRHSLALAILLGLTLGLKILTTGRMAHADDTRLARDMAAMLGADGFRVAVVPHHLFPYVLAQRGDCTLIAANAVTNGYLRDRFAGEAARVGPTLYLHGPVRAGAFPRFLPVISERLQNWSYRLGIVAPRTPIISIAASPACHLDSIAWSALRVWPMPLRSSDVP